MSNQLELKDLSEGFNFSLTSVLIEGFKKSKNEKSISTLSLYSKKGLEIYEEITKLEAYYPFNAELEILKTYSDEISCRMFGLDSSVLLTNEYLNSTGAHTNGNSNGNGMKFETELTPSSNGPSSNGPANRKEKWGDSVVGESNEGVNGGLNGSSKNNRSGLAVELGSGSLEKTKVLLRSISKLLKQVDEDGESLFNSIEYRALDLERDSLSSTLSKLIEEEKTTVTPTSDGTPRVKVSGLIATYDSGLASLNSSPSSPSTTSTVNNNNSKSLLWLGSSVGNFTRSAAAEFLSNISNNVLNQGDTILIGIDNCNDEAKILEGYNDAEGVTRRFILEGVNNAGKVLNCEGILNDQNFEYVTRWNKEEGRHEAYVKSKIEGLTIPLPLDENGLSQDVTLSKDELIHIEFSYKYTHSEALTLFNSSGLRLIQHWTDSRNLHSIYLLEKPGFFFPSSVTLKTLAKEQKGVEFNPYGVPSLDDWNNLWKCWDMVTREITPSHLLMKKPIPLRHIILFYLGHIPAFLDIHLTKYFGFAPCEPAYYHVLFERGIDPNVADPTKITHSHSVVPTSESDWPKVEEIVGFQQNVRARVEGIYKDYVDTKGKMTRKLARTLALMFEHEAMHMETLVYIVLQAADSLQPTKSFLTPDFKSLSKSWNSSIKTQGKVARSTILEFESQSVKVGQNDDDRQDLSAPFDEQFSMGWDVESPERYIQVDRFKLEALPVSNLEYFNYLASLPSTTESKKIGINFPSSWSTTQNNEEEFDQFLPIKVKTLYGEIEFEFCKHWPVTASARQLEGYAKSKGGRLPTQGELSVFFQQNPVDSTASNISFANLHPIPATLPSKQRDGTISGADSGGVWMWSSTLLEAHEGYSPSLLYPGYSSDFHDGEHQLILGGSYVTIARFARSTGVNWYQGAYPFVVAGARIAYDC